MNDLKCPICRSNSCVLVESPLFQIRCSRCVFKTCESDDRETVNAEYAKGIELSEFDEDFFGF